MLQKARTAAKDFAERLPRLTWLDARYGSTLRAVAPALVVTLVIVVLALAPATVTVEMVTARVVELALRGLVGRHPKLDPRIKVFAFDDATLTMVGMPDLRLSDWAKIITALDAKKPRLIVIDKIFAQVAPDDDLQIFTAAIKRAQARVLVGAFVSNEEIKGREPLDLSLNGFDARNFQATGPPPEPMPGFPYGPLKPLAVTLGDKLGIGHVNLESGGARHPFFAFPGGRILPSLPLLVAQDLRLDGPDTMVADGVPVPVDHLGRQPSGFTPPQEIVSRSFSMRALIQRARAGQDISVVTAGDVVAILPQMFTGNTDFFETPYGRQQGGYLLVSSLNDVLLARYPYPVPWRGGLVVLGGILGIWLGMRVRLPRVLIAVLGVSLGEALLGSVFYACFDVISPWLPCGLATLAGGSLLYLERERNETLRRVRVDAALETAAALQMITIPSPEFASEELKIAAAYIPADECAGDWWHHFEIGGLRYLIVADATGHGVAAALISTASRAALESLSIAGDELNPRAILVRMHQVLRSMGGTNLTTCCCVIAIDLVGGNIKVANAGMCLPMLFPADPRDDRLAASGKRSGLAKHGVHIIRATGSPLGMLDTFDAKMLTIPIKPGDRLVMFSDGISEARNPYGKQWGRSSLVQAVDMHRRGSAAIIRESVLDALDEFRKDVPFDDDVTIVVIEITRLRGAMAKVV